MSVEDLKAASAGVAEGAERECPVQTIGYKGKTVFLISPAGVLHAVPVRELVPNMLALIFEDQFKWLRERYVREDAEGKVRGIDFASAARFLILRCTERGLFEPGDQVRGVGYWPGDPLDPDAALIVHAGDEVLIDGEWRKPGRIGEHIYVAAPAVPRPGDRAMTKQESDRLLKLLGRWKWRDPVSPRLLLGWLAAAVVPGALEWRPHLWVSGDRASGKTTLQKLISDLLGRSLLHLADTTEAGVRQLLAGAARPVSLDEIEPEETNDRAQAVVRLARLASQRGGGLVARGATDGTATTTALDAVFLFSSILRPPLAPQDLQRITVLDLEAVDATSEERAGLLAEIRAVKALGPMLRRRLVEQWPRAAATIDSYHSALVSQGHPTRSADQLGALLGMADLLLEDHLDIPEVIRAICEDYDPADLAERLDDAPDHDRCLMHLLTSPLPLLKSGSMRTVGRVVADAFRTEDEEHLADLRQCGLTIAREATGRFLAVASNHQMLARLFADTHWRARAGATGAWVQALRRVPGSRVAEHPVRFGATRSRATLVPEEALPIARADDVPSSVPGEPRGDSTA